VSGAGGAERTERGSAPGYLFFTERTLATFRAAAECIVPDDEGSRGAASEGALAVADRALAARPERDRKLLGTFLRAVELLPLLRYGRRFSSLGLVKRQATLAWLESTRLSPKLRQGFFGLKTFALMGYYAQAETWADLGYPGPRLDAPYYRLHAGER
jgi:hypothetical protein